MSDSARRVQTNTQYEFHPGFVVLPADGTILRASNEVSSLSFYVEHMIPEIRDGKTNANRFSREIRVELRIPTSALVGLWVQIGDSLQVLKDGKAESVIMAPNARDTSATSETLGYDLNGADTKRVEKS